MDLTVTLSSMAEKYFGENPRQKIEELIEKEAVRLYHVERSRPRVDVVPANAEVKRLGETLLAVYAKKRARYAPEPLPAYLAAQERAIHEAIEKGDVRGLKFMIVDQKWQEKQ